MSQPDPLRFFLGATLLLAPAITTAQSVPKPATRPAETAAAAQLRQAIAIAQQGDLPRALALTQQLIAAHPAFAAAYKFQGSLLEQAGNGPQAVTAYRKALQLAPGDSELMLKVGTLDLVAGDIDGAIAIFTRSLKLLPRDGDTLYYLAQAYHLKGNNDLALKTIDRCVKVEPNNPEVWQKYGELLCSSGDNKTALHWLTKAQAADASLERIDYDLAVASFQDQDLEDAARYAAKAEQLRPSDPKGLALLAEIDAKLGHWQEAKPVYERMLADNPDDVPALLGLGHCDLSLKNYQPAADTLERLLRLDPTQVLAHFYLSRAYAALGRPEDAAHEADLHAKLLEQSASAPTGDARQIETATVAQARDLLAASREADAVQLFKKTAKGPNATAGAPYMLVGSVYLSMGRYDDAKRCLDQSLAIEPTVRGAHTYLGILALQQSDLVRAETEFNAELAAEPNYQLAVAELGGVRYRQQRWADAADLIARSRTVVPSLLYMLCDAYFQLGKTREADLTAELIVDYAKADTGIRQRVLDLLESHHQTDLAQRLASR